MVGVTGSIPVAPTSQSNDLPVQGDVEEMPANRGLLYVEFSLGGLRRDRIPVLWGLSPGEESRILALGRDGWVAWPTRPESQWPDYCHWSDYREGLVG